MRMKGWVPCTPNVHLGAIRAVAQKQFGGPIPQCNNICGKRVASNVVRGQTEVSQLQLTLIQQQIGRCKSEYVRECIRIWFSDPYGSPRQRGMSLMLLLPLISLCIMPARWHWWRPSSTCLKRHLVCSGVKLKFFKDNRPDKSFSMYSKANTNSPSFDESVGACCYA